MDDNKAQAIVEGVLFAAGDSVEISKIADILDTDKRKATKIVEALAKKYDAEKRGLAIIRLENSYQMCTRGEYYEYISLLAEPKRAQTMSNAAMEVLAIVAYKQPVTRTQIEDIRGVSCDAVVNRLIERGLIKEAGRLEAPGRPMVFATTEEFLRIFGVESLTELPDYDIIRDNKEEGLYSQQVMDGLDEL